MLSIETQRDWFTQHLSGSGFEVGVADPTLQAPPGARIDASLFRLKSAAGGGRGKGDKKTVIDEADLAGLPSGSADFIVANHRLELSPNPLRMLAEIGRILKPGGVLMLSAAIPEFNPDNKRPITPLRAAVAAFERQADEPADRQRLEFTWAWAPGCFEAPADIETLVRRMWREDRPSVTKADLEALTDIDAEQVGRILAEGTAVRCNVLTPSNTIEIAAEAGRRGDVSLIPVDFAWGKGMISEFILVFRALPTADAQSPTGQIFQAAAAATIRRVLRNDLWIHGLVTARRDEWIEQQLEISRLRSLLEKA